MEGKPNSPEFVFCSSRPKKPKPPEIPKPLEFAPRPKPLGSSSGTKPSETARCPPLLDNQEIEEESQSQPNDSMSGHQDLKTKYNDMSSGSRRVGIRGNNHTESSLILPSSLLDNQIVFGCAARKRKSGVEIHDNNDTENSLFFPSLLDNQESMRYFSGHQDRKTEFDETLKGVLLPEMCEVHEQCVYKVPPRIRKAHPQAYTPQIISIGPFHNPLGRGPRGLRAQEHTNTFWSMEDLKLKYLKGFLNRTKLSAKDLFSKLKKLENRIRSCYEGPVFYDNNDFLKIIITDACFIIELFLRNSEFGGGSWKNDPILSKPWLFAHIQADLILLENQLPFFVLEEIYEIACLNLKPESPSFVKITSHYFEEFNKHNINTEGESPKHFIDLLIIFLKPSSFEFGQKEQENNPISCCSQCTGDFQIEIYISKKKEENNLIDHVYSVSQLCEAGLQFEVSKDKDRECLLDLKFDDKKGVLKMPCFHVHDTTEIDLRNILAFEECHSPDSGYIAQYLKILDFLINTEKDVSILIEKKIIVNWMGDANSVATMINNLNNNVSMPTFNPKYDSLCRSLNRFYENPCNKCMAIILHEYFSTPCKIASSIAALLLIVLTFTQTVCSLR